jgi:hypothetical protein
MTERCDDTLTPADNLAGLDPQERDFLRRYQRGHLGRALVCTLVLELGLPGLVLVLWQRGVAVPTLVTIVGSCLLLTVCAIVYERWRAWQAATILARSQRRRQQQQAERNHAGWLQRAGRASRWAAILCVLYGKAG